MMQGNVAFSSFVITIYTLINSQNSYDLLLHQIMIFAQTLQAWIHHRNIFSSFSAS